MQSNVKSDVGTKLYKSTDGGLTYELLFELDFVNYPTFYMRKGIGYIKTLSVHSSNC